MGLFSISSTKSESFPWIELTSSDQLKTAIEHSTERPILLFKHSTRCSISSMAKSRFEKNWNQENKVCDLYYLDLIAFRAISNEIENITGVVHQSPQAILLKNKKVIYQETHSSIDASDIEKSLE